MIQTFEMPFHAEMLADLRTRLRATRWADSTTSDWSQGSERNFLQHLVQHWVQRYDWRSRLEELNRLPHFRCEVDGFGLHLLHFRSEAANAIPLLLMNGWPSSFLEYQRLAPLLLHGDPAFNVVIPALPGFGFSERPTLPYQVEPAELFPKLMRTLGYERFLVSGTDIGAGVATRIALYYPDRVLAVHVSAIAAKPASDDDGPPTAGIAEFEARAAVWNRDEGGYQAIQSSRPQTLAFGLADSPVGLASWIVEKFRAWSDCGGDVLSVFPIEALIDNLMVYWSTNTIASSVRYYYDAARLRPPLAANAFVSAPTAITLWPNDLALPPRELAERLYNVRSYVVMPRGGHFPAWEAPELYAAQLRALATFA